MYQINIDCPDDKKLIKKILDTLAKAGAGKLGKYSRGATILKTQTTWKTETGATPFIGEVGKISIVNSVTIQTICDRKYLKKVYQAIKKVHPYEEPIIAIIKLQTPPTK